jgi:hypothetical protein
MVQVRRVEEGTGQPVKGENLQESRRETKKASQEKYKG